jgi:hypothetical protein
MVLSKNQVEVKFMAEKTTKKPKTTTQNGYDIPTLKNPLKTWWGKVIVIVILGGMVLLPFIGLIIALFTKE